MERPDISDAIAARFWSKVDRRGPDECWPWIAGKSGNGYGAFAINRRLFVATHVSLYISGHPRTAAQALHSCDNPICVNPSHLRWGTSSDNMSDMVIRGRSMRGERNSTAVLTREDVVEIRASPLSLRALAAKYGVQFPAIYKIKAGRTWKHLP